MLELHLASLVPDAHRGGGTPRDVGEALWRIGYTAREISDMTGLTLHSVSTYAKRYKWARTPEGIARRDAYIESQRQRWAINGNANRWADWCALEGSHEDRDRRFVRALLTAMLEAVRARAA